MPLPDLAATSLAITPWPDPVIDQLGHDPRSTYVETFWLSILGPSTTWLARRLADGLERHPDGFDLPLAETARSLGLGTRGGQHSPFVRALRRCVQFGVATWSGSQGLAVRRRLPPLTRAQIERLPPELQAAHAQWQQAPEVTDLPRQRARALALGLLQLGEDLEAIERHLHRWRVHPALAHDAVRWAREHQRAQAAAAPAPAIELRAGGGFSGDAA